MTGGSRVGDDIEDLVASYRAAAKLHGEATGIGDHQAANRAAKRIAKIYSELRSRGTVAQAALLPLLTDPAEGVRLWAGSHALEFAPDEGETALEKLSAGREFLGMSAQVTLNEWRAGRLRFP